MPSVYSVIRSHTYTSDVRRIQIHIEEDLDDLLQLEAAKLNRSKASLIQECVSARYGKEPQTGNDPLEAMIGTVDIDPENVDDVVYGQ